MKFLGLVLVILLTANLATEALTSNKQTSGEELLTSHFNSCQLPQSLTRGRIDKLVSEVSKAINDKDGEKFFKLHTKWPEPKTDQERRTIELAKNAIGQVSRVAELGPVQDDSFQGFEYTGDSDGSELFAFTYHLPALNNDRLNRAVMRFIMVFDGGAAGLRRTEIKFQ